jgi:flavorubredoxin
MQAVRIKDNVYWVGGIDWNLRSFHGYLTQRGSTYNAYLIIDEKITLVDTVKHYLCDEMLARIASVADPAKIDVIVTNHVEMDHSGSLPKIMQVAKNAKIYCSPNSEKGLKLHYGPDLTCTVVKTGDTLKLGKHSLAFVLTPMVHWPDNMVSYCPEEKLLFSNDGFGQHIASSERFDDEYPLDIILEEAKKYYANIVLPYGAQVQKALETVGGLPLEIIAPSHGLIWRKSIPAIIAEYKKWSANETVHKAVIVYDTMWNSTAKIARAVADAFAERSIPATLLHLSHTHISDIMTHLADARYICVGSPTLNNGIMPTVAAFLTYLKGLAPKKRVGLAFGSYGWGGQSVGLVEETLKVSGCDTMLGKIAVNYVPGDDALAGITRQLASELPTKP